ncbi:uncharacterized protein [Palaemon carinicauda]|uniref:uncharacterized protein n=1 Tax=Palaemon carinicauda TaxID=392227 RepID=UPI0035B67E75
MQLDFNHPRKAGYRNGYSTTDYIHVINLLIEESTENDKPLCMTFINYVTAFDSVKTSAVRKSFQRQRIGESYVRTFEYIYKGNTETIKLHKDSDKFRLRKFTWETPTLLNYSQNAHKKFQDLDWKMQELTLMGNTLTT